MLANMFQGNVQECASQAFQLLDIDVQKQVLSKLFLCAC